MEYLLDVLPYGSGRRHVLLERYNCFHGKARDKAARLQTRSRGAIALLVCIVPAVLSITFVCGNERDDFIPPAYFPAHVCGCALACNLPHRYRLPEGPPTVVGFADIGSGKSLCWRIFANRDPWSPFRSFFSAAPAPLFLNPVA